MRFQPPNSHELAIWRKAGRLYDRAANQLAAARLLYDFSRFVADHSSAFSVPVKLAGSTWSQSFLLDIDRLNQLMESIAVVMAAADRGELAARPTPDGKDLDIVAPAPMDPRWSPYQINAKDIPTDPNLGNPLIILGVIVVAIIGSVLTVLALVEGYSNKLVRDAQKDILEAEKKFCADPNSPACIEWLKRTKTPELKETKSAIDWLLGRGSGGKLAGGLALAFVIGAGLYFWPKQRAR